MFDEHLPSDTAPTPTWSPERIAALKELWYEGVTAAEIGRRLGVTKNAVLGKVHRLDYEPRVIRDVPLPSRNRNAFNFTGPVCMYPFGNPSDPDFHFCGSPELEQGKPYCSTHANLAYIPKDQKQKNATA